MFELLIDDLKYHEVVAIIGAQVEFFMTVKFTTVKKQFSQLVK